ncbi:MAG TPA: hypothetical protein VNY52_13205 [Solirubrobacteraceae bacterium]|jgi:hypothetical protein|nr:hypothetical protein [Solirubrobacteraceae bacterium]
MNKIKIATGLITLLCVGVGLTGVATAKFNAEEAVENSVKVKGKKTKFKIGMIVVKCEKIKGEGQVDKKRGRTGEKEEEDEPSAEVTKESEFLDLKLVWEECTALRGLKGEEMKANVNNETKENTCQFELSQKEKEENAAKEKIAKFSMRAATKGKACKFTIEIPFFNCTIGIHAEKPGENENLSEFKVANIAAFKSELAVGSAIKGIKVAGVTAGCGFSAAEEKEIKEGMNTAFELTEKVEIEKSEFK